MSRSPTPREIDEMPADSLEHEEDLQVLITFFSKSFRHLHSHLVRNGWSYIRESYLQGHNMSFVYRSPTGSHTISLMYYRQRKGNYYCKFCILDGAKLTLAEVTNLVCA